MSIVVARSPVAACEPAPPPSWREAMKLAIRDPDALCQILDLPPEVVEPARAAARHFGLFAPHEFVARIARGDVLDPLLAQVLPLAAELDSPPGFSADPVGDGQAVQQPGLLKKYQGRALLVLTGACPVHCRYCFRRHFPYDQAPRSLADWRPALAAIAADPTIEEVILSGGDPLTVVDEQLAPLVESIAAIGSVRRLRMHTRMPIMIPQRVDEQLLRWLGAAQLATVVVIHANHAREIDAAVAAALDRLAGAGALLLNQSVLLRGVNDDAQTLMDLSRRLLECRVAPYYLHQLDRVQGAAHFETPEATGRALIEALRRALPGYAVPRYVREVPGELHKLVLA
ncbi:MAG: EF-P beta-lysylation protein EpmB [Planctomycetales bacterium]|nr:EF-P beta-lysylation protein EpmB [Planctomycetales bacterium]